MIGRGSLADLARLRDFERHRLSSWDRSGGNADALRVEPGETASLGEIAGAGCVKHVWVTLMTLPTGSARAVQGGAPGMFWDGEASPSIEMPVGDFFGLGFGRRRGFDVAAAADASPEDGKAMNCWFPMPFAQGARFEVENQSESLLIFYYYVDYEAYPEIGSGAGPLPRRLEPDAPHRRAGLGAGLDPRRLPARRPPRAPAWASGAPWKEPNLDRARNYVILDVRGEGQYVGCVLNVDVFERQVNDWYGEGDDMIFVDDEPWPPRLHGTGTEDYFNTAFCPTQTFSSALPRA